MTEKEEMDAIIDKHPFRKMIYDRIPSEILRIRGFGCNEGELLLRLKGVKTSLNCKEWKSMNKPLELWRGSWTEVGYWTVEKKMRTWTRATWSFSTIS